MGLLLPVNEVCEGYIFTGVCLSTGGGFLVSVQGISVQAGLCLGGLCPGGLYPGGLSVQWISIQGRSLSGGSLSGRSLSGGSLSGGVSVRETPCTVMGGRYVSYWNAFLFTMINIHCIS